MKWVPLSFVLLFTASLATAAPSPASTRADDGEARITLDVKDADVVDVVRLLARAGDFQVVVDPGVSCKLTLALKEVRWLQALELSLRSCGLGYDEEGDIFRIAPVAKLTAERAEQRKLAEERGLNRPLRTRTFRLSYARAADVAPLVQKTLLSPRGSVWFDARTNTLFIQDIE